MRLGDLGQGQAGQVRVTQLEHPRAQREAPVGEVHVAELDERQQEPARCRARETRCPRHIAERELAVLGVERTDHRQPALERLDEV